jgi:hypothetical protein
MISCKPSPRLCTCFSLQTRIPFFYIVPRGHNIIFHLRTCSCASRRAAQWLGHVFGSPGRLASSCCVLQSRAYWLSAGSLGCGLDLPTWHVWCGGLSAQVFGGRGSHTDVLLPSGGHGASSTGRRLVPSSFNFLRDPSLVEIGGEPRTPPQHSLLWEAARPLPLPHQPYRSWVAGRLSWLVRPVKAWVQVPWI